ncbi:MULTISPECIES: MBL fold metallo-hydrolase [unclassified Virgibacillus]|uniref:MBL fold metallo-hydrolase n=1 Tax=unclassified Virgibacillus TaxID=2620237 RepID=UPI0024DE7680|nr:MBL fold metallo-hydrolase [Virgibacillus sp. LDC-1]
MTFHINSIHQLTIPTPFSVGDTHVYLLKGDTLTLIDAGIKTVEAKKAMTEQLHALGYGLEDIEQIILTHHHPDHIGLIEAFPRLQHLVADQKVDAWLTRDEAFLQSYEQFFRELFISSGVPAHFYPYLDQLRKPLSYAGKGKLTKTLGEGDLLPGHEDWVTVNTAGHAQSHLSFYREKDGTFIGGDHLLYHISSNPLLEPPINQKERPKPLLQYRQNLEKCLRMDINQVLPGHGKIFTEPAPIIKDRLKKQEERALKVLSMVRSHPSSAFQLCQQLFPHQYERQLDLTMSETIGQLDYLEEKKLIKKRMKDGVFIYYEQTN